MSDKEKIDYSLKMYVLINKTTQSNKSLYYMRIIEGILRGNKTKEEIEEIIRDETK